MRLKEPQCAGDMPPCVVRVPHDVALGAQPDVLPFERMPKRDMGDLFREADGEADVRDVDRVAQGMLSGPGRILRPALDVDLVKLVGLADVVAESSSEHRIAINYDFREGRLEYLDELQRQLRDASQVLGLIASFEN